MIRSTTDSTQRGDLPSTENDGGNSCKQLRSSLGLARDDDEHDPPYRQLSSTPHWPWPTHLLFLTSENLLASRLRCMYT